jgi:ribosomal protein L32
MSRLPQSPSSEERSMRPGERGRARRRLRYLRQVRELQLRDLGGFVLDLYRFGQQRDHLVREKLDAIIATDKETHALEALLDQRQRTYEMRQPGVGGACPNCGDLHASHARFCAQCGVDLREAAKEDKSSEAGPAEAEPTAEAEPATEAAEPPAETIRLEPGSAPEGGAALPGPEEPGWPEPDSSPQPAEAVELDTVRRRRTQP